MKRLFSLILVIVLLFTFSACTQKESASLISGTVNKDVFADTSDSSLSKVMVNLMNYRETKTGFSAVGTQADKDKLAYIETLFNDIGLSNVHRVSVPMDGWVLSENSISIDCNCNEEGMLEVSRVGVYPCNVQWKNKAMQMCYIGEGTDEDFEKYAVKGFGVYISNLNALSHKVDKAIEKGALFVMYPMEKTMSYTQIGIDLSANVSKEIPVIVISNSVHSSIDNYYDVGDYINTKMSISSSIEEDIDGEFLIGEIKGKSSNVVYVTANRDTLNYSFRGSNLNVAELVQLAKELVNSKYYPSYTIRFMVTTGAEYGENDGNPQNGGIKNYLKSLSDKELSAIKGVIVLDGGVPVEDVVFCEVQASNGIKEKVESYRNEYFSKNDDPVILEVKDLSDDRITEALIWDEYSIPVIVKAEPISSPYAYIENTTGDEPGAQLDKIGENFNYNFYLGLIRKIAN